MGRTKKPTEEQLEIAAILDIKVIGDIGAIALQKLIDAKELENVANATPIEEAGADANADATADESGADASVEDTDATNETDNSGSDTTDELDGQNNEGDLVDNSGTDTTQDPVPEVTPEVTPEIKPEDTPPAPEVTPTPEIKPAVEEEGIDPEPKLDMKGIAAIVSSADLDGKAKVRKIADDGMVMFAGIASKIIGYDEAMNPKIGITEQAGAAKQYDLLNTLKSVINTEDYKVFKAKFDIINLGFRAYSKDSFDEFMLFRFDQKWKWSKKDLTTSQHLSTLISQLCDLSTRADSLKKIDIDRALDASVITLSETGISNIKKYYTM